MKLEKIHYQSDWAEAGFLSPLSRFFVGDNNGQSIHEKKISGADFRWMIRENRFESGFYECPVLELRLEVDDPGIVFLSDQMDNQLLHREIYRGTAEIIRDSTWGETYMYSRLLRHEPLFCALRRLDFGEVEQRRLYGCRFGELKGHRVEKLSDRNIRYCSLAAFASGRIPDLKEQILDLCRDAFGIGYTRHFTDAFFSKKKPGTEYILAVMEINFRNVDPRHFLVAVDEGDAAICGFTVLGKKSGVEGNVYTQLLSAVSRLYQGQGIYRGLTDLAASTFPPGAGLFNVTHVGNRKIQRAYQDSGRRHVADTVVLRRVFSASTSK
ncbi:MAG: hypothetical protein ABIJ42_11120 [Acidobacteriota bacterium]